TRQNCSKPQRYCTRRGALCFHRHPPGQIFAEREGSHEVPNRCLERHWVDCGLPCALPLCTQRFDHVEIMACLMSPKVTEKLARFCTGQCPLWVKSGHRTRSVSCPLYPQKRTLVERVGMSALCQKRTYQLLRLYVDLLLNNNR